MSRSEGLMVGFLDAAYLAAGAATGFVGMNSIGKAGARSWLLASFTLMLLALLRSAQAALTIDHLLATFLRVGHLYEERRLIQVICLVVLAAALMSGLVRLSRHAGSELAVTLSATFFLLAFVAVRASSLHWTDKWLAMRVGATSLSHLVQAIGLGAVFAGTLLGTIPSNQKR